MKAHHRDTETQRSEDPESLNIEASRRPDIPSWFLVLGPKPRCLCVSVVQTLDFPATCLYPRRTIIVSSAAYGPQEEHPTQCFRKEAVERSSRGSGREHPGNSVASRASGRVAKTHQSQGECEYGALGQEERPAVARRKMEHARCVHTRSPTTVWSILSSAST